MRMFPGSRPGRLLGLLALVLLLPVLGCGKSTATVTGTVSYKGTKLKGGQVIFSTADGKGGGASGDINEDGTYTVEKCPVGNMKVSVKTSHLKPPPGKPMKNEPPKDAKVPEGYKPGNSEDRAKLYVAIPEKYEDPATSGLTFEVKSGSQTYPITLE